MSGKKEVVAEKIYEMTEYEEDGLLFISEYYVTGGDIDYSETRISKYNFGIGPDMTIEHTIIREGHKLKNIIRFIDETKKGEAAEG